MGWKKEWKDSSKKKRPGRENESTLQTAADSSLTSSRTCTSIHRDQTEWSEIFRECLFLAFTLFLDSLTVSEKSWRWKWCGRSLVSDLVGQTKQSHHWAAKNASYPHTLMMTWHTGQFEHRFSFHSLSCLFLRLNASGPGEQQQVGWGELECLWWEN